MDPLPKTSATFYLFDDISNMREIKDLVSKGALGVAVVNPTLIYHPDQLRLAAFRCLYAHNSQQLKTKSIFTELLYALHPTRSIRDALLHFGAQEEATTTILVLFSSGEDCNGLESRVKGTKVSMDRISELRDVDAIKKMYKIPSGIVDEETILNAVLTKMAAKELLL